MQRPLVVVLFVLLAVLAVAAFFLFGEDAAPPVPGPGTPAAAAEAPAVVAPAAAGVVTANAAAADRQRAVGNRDPRAGDPEIAPHLCGFKGRVVDAKKQPVGDCGVRIYRGAVDAIVPLEADLFGPRADYTPNYLAGEVRTAADGTWLLTGVWPRAIYVLFAGLGTDAPMHQLVTKTPSAGEVVDLGDIVLPDAGVLTGTVLDDAGEPLAGALVRAADIPGALAAFIPIERFDPQGAVLVREEGPVRVVEMPAWVQAAFDDLPIPSTRSGADGRFRLVGVVPGSNMVATTATGFLSDVKASVPVRSGQEKDIGRIRMKRGEELSGKVVDTAGKAVAGAEVFAGSTLTIAPVDLAQRLPPTDAEGRFTGTGFSSGKVTVAARRGKGHAWVLAEPQPIFGDVVVTLPTTFDLEVRLLSAAAVPIARPRFQLLQGKPGNGAAEMYLLGFATPLDLTERMRDLGEGRWQFQQINPGPYTLLADAPGHGMASFAFEIKDADTSFDLTLPAPNRFVVRVVSDEDKPVANAEIHAEASGQGKVIDMPVRVGRTKADGSCTIDKLAGEQLRVSAEHPRWGIVGGTVKRGEELVLRMVSPGSLRLLVTDGGKPPELGKYTVLLLSERDRSQRGAVDEVPTMLTPGLDGTILVKALQPGKYRVVATKALDALRSPGGVYTMMQDMFLMRNERSEQFQIVSGQEIEVPFEVADKPIEGPTAQLAGTCTVDAKLAKGNMLSLRVAGNDRQFAARVDERGRFDFGIVPAGDATVTLRTSSVEFFAGPPMELWESVVPLAPGEAKELPIDVMTSSIAGTCYKADGQPAAGIWVQASGVPKGATKGSGLWAGVSTDSRGEFSFPQVAEGTWSLSVRGYGRRGQGRAELTGLQVLNGAPLTGLRLDMKVGAVVAGTVDLAALGGRKVRWAWLMFERMSDGETGDIRGTIHCGLEENRFSTDELSAGRYRVELTANFDGAGNGNERERGSFSCGELTVPAGGLKDVRLVAQPKPK